MEDREFWRNERIAFLALSALKGIGFWTLHKIAQSKIGFKVILKEPEKVGLDKLLQDEGCGGEEGQIELWNRGISIARDLASQGIHLCFKSEPDFPKKLSEISDAPEWLFVQGRLENLCRPAVTIVGTRKPSDDGYFLTRYVTTVLTKTQFVTVSGLASGIDQTAHLESIRYGIPTVAVLGTGILQDYPKGSDVVRKHILEGGGTIVSEYLPTQSYSADNFVRRNRLQAALGNVLIPTEWAIKSGTAHTVRFASKYNRLILNICLPGQLGQSPEMLYAEQEYGAYSFELPCEERLLSFIESTLPGSSFSDIEVANGATNFPTLVEINKSDLDDIEVDLEFDKERQLRLI